MRQPYIVYHRGGSTWTVAFWDYDRRTYARRVAGSELVVSLGDRAKHLLCTARTRAAAEEAARIALEACTSSTAGSAGDLLGPYLERFWDEDGDYGTAYRAREGHPLSAEYLLGCRSAIGCRVLPWLREHQLASLELPWVTTAHLEALVMHLYKASGLSASRINGIRGAISRALEEAKRLKKIPVNPMRDTTHVREPVHRREILTREEAARVLGAIADARVRLVNLLAATTGMRLGELPGAAPGAPRLGRRPRDRTQLAAAGGDEGAEDGKRAEGAAGRAGGEGAAAPGGAESLGKRQSRRPLSERVVQEAYVEAVHAAGIPEEETSQT